MRRPLLCCLTLFLAIALVACGDDGDDDRVIEDSEPSEDTVDPNLPDDVVVFTPDDVERDNYGEEVTWTPSAEDIEGTEAALSDHIEANPDLGVDPLESYHRQYVGTGQDGELVSVQALCQVDDFDDWEDELILVNDGGSCFWQATFSFRTLEVESFSVNGEA